MDVVQSTMQEEGLNTTLVTGSPDDIVEIDDSEGDEVDFTATLSAKKKQTPANEKMVQLSDHPLYAKLFKMLKVGVPVQVVTEMAAEKLDEYIIDRPGDPLEKKKEAKMVPVSEHRMLKVGVALHVMKAKRLRRLHRISIVLSLTSQTTS